MKRFVITSLFFVIVVAAALVYFTYPRPTPRGASLLPDTTLLFLHIPDFSRTCAELRNSQVHALWNDPEVQVFLAEPRHRLEELLSFANAPTNGADPDIGPLELAPGEVFVAVTQISVAPTLQPGLVLCIETKRKPPEARGMLRSYSRRLTRQYPSLSATRTDYLGVQYGLRKVRPGVEFCHALLNSTIVITFGENTMRDVITRFTGVAESTAPSLADSPRYRDVVRQLPKDRAFMAYVNVEELMKLAGPFLALASSGRSGALQKLTRIQATATGVTFDETKIRDVGYTAYSTALAPPPVTRRKTLALTTPRTALYACYSTDLAAAYRQAMDSLAQSGNPTLVNSAAQFERSLTQRGVRLREDVLAKLGPEIATIATWRDGTAFPDIAFVAEIKDARSREAVDATMDALKQVALGDDERSPWDATQDLGETLRTVRPAAATVSPTYTVTDRFFILASTLDYAREILSQLKRPGPTLAANADYLHATKRLPSNANDYFYCDLRSVVGPLFALAHANATTDSTNAWLSAATLPQGETITRYLAPFASATVATEKSETTTSISSLGKPLTIAVVGLGALVAAQPFLSQLPVSIIPGLPIPSSDTVVPLPLPENPAEASQNPPTQ